ncbi:Predicted oxidoreductase, contains short-chain dehydrogenase (SDR) and DUF2520 domains [Sphingobium sp. AP50]|uniref:Rossmann-like and DUF2520 domain-containing protein n=1 Tax=Sphingobium sp. AP50 TaxID=1884369 RepID=UPI0008CF75B2|nr:DUF2520 domain-containing protein [Sphingobium sp. AP50]SEI67262.1 Predicted oxidoreductase, contains short-chain dehydrogenase (SDR) and DUF2520 domains [Sphingobium sp. AP50]
MQQTIAYRQIGIVGTGRVARAMALALHRHCAEPLMLWGRDPDQARAVADIMGPVHAVESLETIIATCDLILIAVSDDALATVIAALAAAGPSSAFACHVSGRSGAAILAPLRDSGLLTAAIHPAMTFTGNPDREVARMAGARFVITGDGPAAAHAAEQLVALLHGVPEYVAEVQRPLYHAALCHAANHLVTLLAGSCDALKTAGVADPQALIGPLVRAALENSLDRGFAALSGPLLRGDEATILDHLTALAADSPALLPPYRAMARATLDQLASTGRPAAPSLAQLLD